MHYAKIPVCLIVLLLALMLSACGGQKTSSNDNASPTDEMQVSDEKHADKKGSDKEQGNKQAPQATEAGNVANAIVRTPDERLAQSDSVNDRPPEDKVVYLTFDDGPSSNTPNILATLDKYGVKATWFVKGNSDSMQYLSDIWDSNNQIAIHTYTHDYEAIYASESAYWGDVNQAADAIEAEVGFRPTLVRFPGGSYNSYNTGLADTLTTDMSLNGFHYFDWNVSSGDGGEHSADEIYGYVTEGANGCHSCCVLMHDSAAKNTTVEALPRIIEYFIDNGYTFDVLVSDSFGYHF